MNDTQIYCVLEENLISAIYTHPPLQEVNNSKNLLEKSFWNNNDWTLKSSNESRKEAIFDKRWESFTLEFTTQLQFEQFDSVSFSIYGSNELRFLANDDDYSYHYSTKVEVDSQWTTFTVLKNKFFYIFQNNNLLYNVGEIGCIEPLVIYLNKPANVKVQEYTYFEATKPSTKKTSLIIPKEENASIIAYITLCAWCNLEIWVDGINKTIISLAKNDAVLEKWQIYKFDLDLTKNNIVDFNRTVSGGQKDGFWSLDIKLYTNKYNIASYTYDKTVLNPENYLCDFLTPVNDTSESLDTLVLKKCQPGELGTNCALKCGDILGDEFSKYNYENCKNENVDKVIDKSKIEKPIGNNYTRHVIYSLVSIIVITYVSLIGVGVYFISKTILSSKNTKQDNLFNKIDEKTSLTANNKL